MLVVTHFENHPAVTWATTLPGVYGDGFTNGNNGKQFISDGHFTEMLGHHTYEQFLQVVAVQEQKELPNQSEL